MDHPPGELLEMDENNNKNSAATTVRKYFGNRSFYDGERSILDIRLSSLYSGINPNPACNILTFFLKTEINFPRMLNTLRDAKKSLDTAKFKDLANEFASEFQVDKFVETAKHALDVDINVDIKDTRIFLVEDTTTNVNSDNKSATNNIQGNICLQIHEICVDRHVDSKYKHLNSFRIDGVHVTCNKEENGKIDTQAIFTPVSCLFKTEREWIVDKKEWNMTVGGSFDKIQLEVTPSHSRVFMDVIHGVKIDNVQKVLNSIVSFSFFLSFLLSYKILIFSCFLLG